MNEQLGNFAHRLADEGGEILKKWFRNIDEAEVSLKSDSTPVCKADLEAEELLRGIIRKHYPHHGVCGEEFGNDNEKAEWVWVLDPLDGTSAFLEGVPVFGSIIALFHRGKPAYGIIDHPVLKERWWGNGKNAFHNGKDCRTSTNGNLNKAVIYASSPHMFNSATKEGFDRLRRKCLKAGYGLHCYSYGLLASGSNCLVAEAGMKLFDYAAMPPIINGAGGVISDWSGDPLGPASGDKVLASANLTLHNQALRCL